VERLAQRIELFVKDVQMFVSNDPCRCDIKWLFLKPVGPAVRGFVAKNRALLGRIRQDDHRGMVDRHAALGNIRRSWFG
jgi:hypothetical protein